MLSKLRTRLTFANVVSVIALFVALGGGAYAAIKLPANSVGSKQIRKKAVTPAKIAPATARLLKGRRGDQGPKGDPGATGSPGQPGSSAASAFVSSFDTGNVGNDTELCPVTNVAYFSSACIEDGTDPAYRYEGSPNVPIVARDLFVRQTVAPGSGATRSYTLRVDGVDTPFGCTVVDPATTCNSGAATFTIPAGSKLIWKIANGATAPASARAYVGWRATTP